MEEKKQEVSPRVTTTRPGPVAGQATRQQGRADIFATVIASVAIALPLVFYLHQHVEILRLGYEIESLKERRVELVETSRELRVERTRGASLARVEEQAALMGLSAPPAQNIYLASSPMTDGAPSVAVAAADGEQTVVARLE